jgi:small-conductance mechanosensitive channel
LPKPAENELDQQIIHTVETAKPESVQQLVDQVQALSLRSKEEIMDRILYLQQEEKIHLEPPRTPTPERFSNYLGSNQALWYWVTMALTIVTAIVVLTVSKDAFPLVYLRYVLGAIFILWLPGYAFIKALFPQTFSLARGLAHSPGTTEKNLDTIERGALSLGMSIVFVSIVGLMLNYTPWGINLAPIVLSLAALTLIFATVAIIREHQIGIKQDANMAK